ncbi:MAG: chemotaxis protein CheW [Candidatus Krumholzibacteria bacterium]|nr:chemotaxis protein CheW [Candidatus Krumholzibacteria bacterium]
MILKEDNRRLFGEQINDHIEKLNDLMGLSSGATFNEQAIRRACLATRLLEGSTRMLGLDGWSVTLKSFRELLERSAGSGRCWDEQLSQIVSEVLETEEQLVAEILAGELEEASRRERFDGLLKEIEFLATEPAAVETEPVSLPGTSSSKKAPRTDQPEISERVPTFTRLIESLTQVRDMFQEFIDKPSHGEKAMRELEVAYGESEFLMGLVAETLRKLGRNSKPFTAKISCGAVLDGLKDFFGTYMRLRRWNAQLATRCSDFTLDCENASTLAAILSGCVFDVCRRYEVRDELSLSIGVDIRGEGSMLVAKIQDNGPDYMCDSEIDRDDAGAFYQCFREVRSRLESYGSLLWLEPDGGNEGRFKFTLPRTRSKTDHQIFTVSGKRLAVPCHAVDTTMEMSAVQTMRSAAGRHVTISGVRVPVFSIEEIAVVDEFDAPGRPDRVLIMGLAEKRVGLLIDGGSRVVECLADQITEGSWASLAKSVLHIGEDEFPIVDVGLVLRMTGSLRGIEGGLEEAGTYADGGRGSDQEVTVPRA